MTWNTSNRAQRLPTNWPALRLLVLRRDRHICRLRIAGICITQATEVDHIVAGDDHSTRNLQAVCSACHARKSALEGVAAQQAERDRKKRPAEKHPGSIDG